MRRTPEEVCLSKKTYRSPDTARRVAEGLTRFRKPHRAYACPCCGLWHLSTQAPRPDGTSRPSTS